METSVETRACLCPNAFRAGVAPRPASSRLPKATWSNGGPGSRTTGPGRLAGSWVCLGTVDSAFGGRGRHSRPFLSRPRPPRDAGQSGGPRPAGHRPAPVCGTGAAGQQLRPCLQLLPGPAPTPQLPRRSPGTGSSHEHRPRVPERLRTGGETRITCGPKMARGRPWARAGGEGRGPEAASAVPGRASRSPGVAGGSPPRPLHTHVSPPPAVGPGDLSGTCRPRRAAAPAGTAPKGFCDAVHPSGT